MQVPQFSSQMFNWIKLHDQLQPALRKPTISSFFNKIKRRGDQSQSIQDHINNNFAMLSEHILQQQRMSKVPVREKQNIVQKCATWTKEDRNILQKRTCLKVEELNMQQLSPNETGCFEGISEQSDCSKEGQDKLIELTAQCAQYFQRFTAEKDMHILILQRAFAQMSHKAELAFGHIIEQSQKALIQINDFLKRQQTRLKEQKRLQEQQLSCLLQEIKGVHLTRLENNPNGMSLKGVLSDYASTLDKFFTVMTAIEAGGCEEGVEQCLGFVSNLVRQQLRDIVEIKLPQRVQEMLSRNFRQQQGFSFQSLLSPRSILQQIGQQQVNRQARINGYISALGKWRNIGK